MPERDQRDRPALAALMAGPLYCFRDWPTPPGVPRAAAGRVLDLARDGVRLRRHVRARDPFRRIGLVDRGWC
jgi:hypothetical protein